MHVPKPKRVTSAGAKNFKYGLEKEKELTDSNMCILYKHPDIRNQSRSCEKDLLNKVSYIPTADKQFTSNIVCRLFTRKLNKMTQN